MNRTLYHDALPVHVPPAKPSIGDLVPITDVPCRCGNRIRTHTPSEPVREIIQCPRCGVRNLLTWGDPEAAGMDPCEAIRYRDLVIDSFDDDEHNRQFVGVRLNLGASIAIDRDVRLMGGKLIRETAIRAAVNHLEERIYGAVRKRGEALARKVDDLRRSLHFASYNPGASDALSALLDEALALRSIGFDQPEGGAS